LSYFLGATPWTSFTDDFTVLGLSVSSSSEFGGKAHKAEYRRSLDMPLLLLRLPLEK